MLLSGYFMLKKPPKKINGIYGYRTWRSKKSQENWDFAQEYAAKHMIKAGWVCLPCCLLAFIYDWSDSLDFILGISIFLIVVFYPIYKTERALKQLKSQ